MTQRTVDVETTAQAYLELLEDRGIDCFFANAGTDFAPLIEAFARRTEEGKRAPRPITVPHENAAVAMAHGYYLVTGKPQIVMVHVNVGSANGVNGIINAARDHIPILFTAGRTPLTETHLPGARDLYIHWGQEAFDQAAMVREYVKWDYELRNFHQLEDVVDRALEVAMSEPRGPVYLTLPREVLAEQQAQFTFLSPPRRHLGGRLFPDPQAIERAADILAAAQRPLIITNAAGRHPLCVENLAALAEAFALPVVSFNPRYMNLPSDHPMHVGYTPDPFLETADAILVVDADVPWYPSKIRPPQGCKVIQLGTDPLFGTYPIRSFPRDVAVRGDSATAVAMLKDALHVHRKALGQQIQARYKRVLEQHKRQKESWRTALDRVRNDAPLDPLWVSHCINDIKDDDTIVVNEYDLVTPQLDLAHTGTYFSISPAGGLGWGLGAALGAKLAAPDRLVIAAVGDGSYMFGNPTPCHFVSRAQNLPILTVIFNNRVWNSVRQSVLGMYPDGWSARTDYVPLSELQPAPQYEVLVTASGGYGERVEQAAEVLPALKRALQAVNEDGRQAVLNMICKHPAQG
jgi:acetolactate synthase-1/2/3 large subunit